MSIRICDGCERSVRRRVMVLRAAFLCTIAMAMAEFSGCIKTPAEPVMPSWQTQLTLPIVDRTYYFSDLVAKDDKFQTLVNGEVVYRPAGLKNTPTAIPLPAVYPVAARVSNTLGAVPLTLPALPSIVLSTMQLLGQAPPQTPWSVGEINTVQNQSIISDTATFDYVTFDKARIILTLTNTDNFDVIFPSGIKVVNVFSATDTSQVLVTFPVGLVKANSSQTMTADISTQTMSSRLRVKFILQTAGIDGHVVSSNGSLIAAIAIDGGTDGSLSTMRSAKVRVTGTYGQVTNKGTMQLIGDSTFIKRAEFTGGVFDLIITNSVPIDFIAGLSIMELINKKTGLPFRLKANGTGAEQDEVLIPSKTTFVQTITLSDYTFLSKNIAGADTLPTANVQYTMTVRTPGATADKRLISANDSIAASIVPRMNAGVVQALTLAKFEGVIRPTVVNINESVATDFGTVADKVSADSIKFDNSTITLNLFTRTTFPADINLRVTAWHNGVKGLSMNVPSGNGGLNGAYRIVPGDTAKIVFNKTTTTNGVTIDRFMNSFVVNGKIQLPDKFVLEGTGTIEPADVYGNGTNGRIGSVTNQDSIYSSLEFSFPVRIAIVNGIFSDTTEFTNTVDRNKMDLLESGKVSFQIENTFPVSGDVSLMMMASKAVRDTLINLTKTPLHVESAVYNASGANTSSSSYSFVALAQGESSKFSGATVTALNARMHTGGGAQPVSFRSTDHIRVKAYGTFKVMVDFDTMNK